MGCKKPLLSFSYAVDSTVPVKCLCYHTIKHSKDLIYLKHNPRVQRVLAQHMATQSL